LEHEERICRLYRKPPMTAPSDRLMKFSRATYLKDESAVEEEESDMETNQEEATPTHGEHTR